MKNQNYFCVKVTTCLFLISIISFAFPQASISFLKGDINNDDTIDISESIHALQVVAGLKIAAFSKIIYVPADIPTIQQAIDSAIEGETIRISEGTYNENLTIEKDKVTIQGAGKGSTIIAGNGTDSTVLVRNSRSIEIMNLSIRNGSDGINLLYSSLKCSDVAIENNIRGLRVRYNSFISIENASIRNNSEYGVRLYLGSTGYFDYCEITGNTANGLTSDRAASVFIDNSKISNNGGSGIQAWLGGNMSGGDNEVKSNGGRGIDITGNSSGSLYGNNLITDNGKNNNAAGGVSVHQSSYLWISNTDDISHNQGPGVIVSDNSALDINGTKINNNSGDGVIIGISSTSKFNGAIINNNSAYGINCSGGKFYEQQPIDFGSSTAGTLNTLGDKSGCN